MRDYTLDQLFDLQMGKTPARDDSSYWSDGINDWISIRDLTNSDKYINSTNEKISDIALKKTGIRLIPQNTVIMSFKLSIGKVAITSKNMYSNEAIMAFHDKKVTEIIPEYLYYLLLGHKWDEGSNKAVMGITLNKATLSKVKISIHDTNSQNNIVSTLSLLDQLIINRKKQLIEYDQLIKSRFVEMFGDPESNTKNYPMVNLSDIANYFNGLTYSPENVSDEGIIVLRSSNIQNSKLDFKDIVRVQLNVKENKIVRKNDILMCSRNGSAKLVGKVALIDNLPEKMAFGAFMMIIRSEYHSYLMSYMQMDAFRRQITTGATTTINQITSRMLDNVKLPLPDMSQVKDFELLVKQVDKLKFEDNFLQYKD